MRKLANGGNQQLTAERYIYEPGTHVPLAMHDTELGTLHFDVDHLGTPKGLFESSGEKLWQAEHSVYGQIESQRSFKLHPVTGEQIAPKIRFQGQYEDSESGLFYNLNRYYDAEVGRYTTQDPIGLLGGLNAYQYCPNPVGWVDPLGFKAKDNEHPEPPIIYSSNDMDSQPNNTPWSMDKNLQWLDKEGNSVPFSWPGNDGFASTYGKIIRYPQVLEKGHRLDRFGGYFDDDGNFIDTGKYFADEGVPFSNRALPPTATGKPHTFKVIKPFEVEAGPIAPWFGEPGGAIQYFSPDKGVDTLIKEGYIERTSEIPDND